MKSDCYCNKINPSEPAIITRKKNVTQLTLLFIVVLLVTGCEEKEHTTIVTGKVINWGSKQPIDSVTIILKDGVGASGFLTTSMTSGKKNIAYTNALGEFSVELTGEYEAFLGVGKKGYQWDPDWNDGISVGVRGFGWEGGVYSNFICEMKAQAFFNGVFKNTGTTSEMDSLFAKLYDGYGLLSAGCCPFEPYVGKGPFTFYAPDSDGAWVTGDSQLRIELKFKRDNHWVIKWDSVYIKSFEVYRDTIFY